MKLKLIIFALFIPFFLKAQQEKLSKNTYLMVELGGIGLVVSVNAAQTIYSNKRLKTVVQAGLGFNSTFKELNRPYNIPFAITNCFGSKRSFFEAGAGATLLFNSKTNNNSNSNTRIYLSPIIGYRRESSSWFAKIYVSPLFLANGKHVSDEVTRDAISLGVGMGFKFKNN
jgi:hypothetical protein